MLVNYYRKYELNRKQDTDTIKEILENMCTGLIRRLNNAGGNAEREYELRKELETLEEALDVFSSEKSRQIYDQQLRDNIKEGMLTNAEQNIIESLEDPEDKNSLDQEKLESLLEKIAAKQIAAIQEKEDKIKNNHSNYNVSGNLNIDKANNLVRLAQMEMDSKLEGYLYVGKNGKLESYIDGALQLDSTNYLAWYAKFVLLLRFRGDKFKFPWDFTTLNQEELARFTKEELDIIYREIQIEMESIGTYGLIQSISEWERTSILENRIVKEEKKSKFSEETISVEEQFAVATIEQIKGCAAVPILTEILDKAYQIHRQRPFSSMEKCWEILKYHEDYGEIERCYSYAIELAPVEEKKDLERSMNQHIDKIYDSFLDEGYSLKKEIMEEYVAKRYEHIMDIEKNVDDGFQRIRKKAEHIRSRAVEQTCYMLMAVMALFMVGWFIPMGAIPAGRIIKFVIMVAGYFIIHQIIIKLRGVYKYKEIIRLIISIPFFIYVASFILGLGKIILFNAGKGSADYLFFNILSFPVILSMFTLIRDLIRDRSSKSIIEKISDAMMKVTFRMLKAVLIGFFITGFMYMLNFNDLSALLHEICFTALKGAFLLECVLVPHWIALKLENSNYHPKEVQGVYADLAIYKFMKLEEPAAYLFPNNKLFEIQ